MATYSISQFVEASGLSRSTLLYYDAIGLLKPDSRTDAGHRVYSEKNLERLSIIVLFRNLHVPLKDIRVFLDAPEGSVVSLLLRRMVALGEEITRLREQQNEIVEIVGADGIVPIVARGSAIIDGLGQAIGATARSYLRMQPTLESASPTARRRILTLLGFSPDESDQ